MRWPVLCVVVAMVPGACIDAPGFEGTTDADADVAAAETGGADAGSDVPETSGCTSDEACDDHNACTIDSCVGGECSFDQRTDLWFYSRTMSAEYPQLAVTPDGGIFVGAAVTPTDRSDTPTAWVARMHETDVSGLGKDQVELAVELPFIERGINTVDALVPHADGSVSVLGRASDDEAGVDQLWVVTLSEHLEVVGDGEAQQEFLVSGALPYAGGKILAWGCRPCNPATPFITILWSNGVTDREWLDGAPLGNMYAAGLAGDTILTLIESAEKAPIAQQLNAKLETDGDPKQLLPSVYHANLRSLHPVAAADGVTHLVGVGEVKAELDAIHDVWLVRLSADGTVLVDESLDMRGDEPDEPGDDIGVAVASDGRDGLIIAVQAWAGPTDSGPNLPGLIRTDPWLNLHWSKTWPEQSGAVLSSVRAHPDGGFVVVGRMSDTEAHHVFVRRIGPFGQRECLETDPCLDGLCDDGEPCTRDTCEPDVGCVNDKLPLGTPCGVDMSCAAGAQCQ